MRQRYRQFTFVLLLLSVYSSFSQNKILDSLKQRIVLEENPLKLASLHNDIAVAFFNQRIYYDSCYYYSERAHLIATENNLEEQRARALFNFALIYSDLGDYDLAIDYFSKAKEVFVPLDNKPNVSVINSSMGGLYFNKKEYEVAKGYFVDAISISESIKDSVGILIDNVNLAETEYYLKEYKDSKQRLEYAKELGTRLNVDFSSLHIYYGNTLYELGDKKRAKEEAHIGLQMAQEDHDIKNEAEASELLYKVSLGEGNVEEALVHYKRYVLHKDSLNEAKQMNTVEKLKLNFELKKHQKELAYLTQKNKYQNIIYVLVGAGLILLVILIFRQFKIARMTQNMHDIQQRLVGVELKERERLAQNADASSYDATVSKEL